MTNSNDEAGDLFGQPLCPLRDARGRRRHLPRRQERDAVEILAGYGLPQDQIARVLMVAPKTLRDRYREELDRGGALANAKVAQNLFAKALGDGREAVTAAMFWLRCRAGWSEYAPSPKERPDAPAAMGKKDAQQLAAETADEGTGWSGLIH